VAGSALEDLRATISGLRRSLEGDLVARLQTHLDEVRSASGPELTFEVTGNAVLDDLERADDVLRVAQEAVSNALRHARAATRDRHAPSRPPTGSTSASRTTGSASRGGSVHPGSGVGLRSMRERAERLDGELEVRERLGGGTVVRLRCPTVRRSNPSLVSDHTRPGR
jgi:signal transduction histidine kinase